MSLLASPTVASKRWIYQQYDHMVRTNTIAPAGAGAGVVRVKGTTRALAMSVDGNGRFVALDPRQGARLALAEASRNVACAGAMPIGATNCLNFGNPERPEIMWQFAEAVAGLGEACRALEIPITGGNVSLYNETDGKAILPTPVLGVVGVIADADRVVTRHFKRPGDVVVLLGQTRPELGGSEYLHRLHGLLRGTPPALDLDAEKRLQRLLVALAADGVLQSAHDTAEGGIAVTLAECCFDTGALGASIDLPAVTATADGARPEWGTDFALFSESVTRVVLSVAPENKDVLLKAASVSGVPATVIGTTGTDRLTIRVGGAAAVDLGVADAERVWSTGLERYFVRS